MGIRQAFDITTKTDHGFWNIVQKSTANPVLAIIVSLLLLLYKQWAITRAYKLITGQKIYIALTQKVSSVNSHATSNQTC